MAWPYPTNPDLIRLAQQELKSQYRVLVTGATGFVGSRLAQALHDAGHAVTISGRSRWRVRSDGRFVAADLTKPNEASRLCEGQQIVIHCAAATSPWGSLDYHRGVNVLGTQHIVDACRQHHVDRLVHVSSTAMYFQFRDRVVDDDTPLPRAFANPYAQTKAEAETIVRQAIKAGLNAYVVRARAVFGPGDNALLPRLVAAAQAGKLRQIGDGQNQCDLTYIDNLLAGLIAAAAPDRPRGVCTITNEEPVKLWQLLHRVLEVMVPEHQADKRVPYWLAQGLATLGQWQHQLLRKRGEPRLTRYSVGLLAKEQIFHSPAAKADLGYRPIVSMAEGVERTLESLIKRDDKPPTSSPSVRLRLFSTGYVLAPRSLVDRSGVKGKVRVHASVALIEHPVFGPILFDAGYTPEFYAATAKFPYRIYRWLTHVITRPQWTADAWLKRCGVNADQLRLILLSHFHGDHIGALKAFSNAEIVTLEKAWGDANCRRGWSALRRAILPELLPADVNGRVHTISEMHYPGIGPLTKCHDLLGDGSIRLFELDGHATGQMGALLNVEGGRQVFLVADASWSRLEIRQQLKPTLAFRLVAANFRHALETRRLLSELARLRPDIEFVCTHCRDVAEAEGFDDIDQEQIKY